MKETMKESNQIKNQFINSNITKKNKATILITLHLKEIKKKTHKIKMLEYQTKSYSN